MFNRHEWASLLGIYGLGACLYALLLTPGFTPAGLVGGLGFMLTGLVLGLCGAVIGRRQGRTIAGIGQLLDVRLGLTFHPTKNGHLLNESVAVFLVKPVKK